MNEFDGEIVGVSLNVDASAVAIKLSNGTAITFDARFPEDVLTIETAAIQPPYWRPMHV